MIPLLINTWSGSGIRFYFMVMTCQTRLERSHKLQRVYKFYVRKYSFIGLSLIYRNFGAKCHVFFFSLGDGVQFPVWHFIYTMSDEHVVIIQLEIMEVDVEEVTFQTQRGIGLAAQRSPELGSNMAVIPHLLHCLTKFRTSSETKCRGFKLLLSFSCP